MSNFLTNVLAKSTGRANAIQPRLPSQFEPLQSQEIFQESLEELDFSSSAESDPPLTSFSQQFSQVQAQPIERPVGGAPVHQASNRTRVVESANSNSQVQSKANAADSFSTTSSNLSKPSPELTAHAQGKEHDSRSLPSPLTAQAGSLKPEGRSLVLQPQVTRIQEPDELPQLPLTSPELPVIKVIIGRVEIKATMTSPKTPSPRSTYRPPQPALSLENYLRSRNGGGG